MTTKDLTVRLTSAALLTGIAMASVACTGSGTRESEVDRTGVTEIAESKDVKPAVADNPVYDEKSNGCFETWTGGEAYGFRTVTFGKYRGEDLEWLILDENESGLLLLTKKAVGARPVDDKDSKYSCSWWLRTPGSGSELTAFVSSFGKILDSGAYVCYYDQGFRPAVWISK